MLLISVIYQACPDAEPFDKRKYEWQKDHSLKAYYAGQLALFAEYKTVCCPAELIGPGIDNRQCEYIFTPIK